MDSETLAEDTLYIMFYSAVTILDIVVCLYLLLRRGNAFAPEITSPVRLRRWAAAFFAVMAMSHLWYMPQFFLASPYDVMRCYFIGSMLDCFTVFPVTLKLMLSMLQDRRRRPWLFLVGFVPFIIAMLWNIFSFKYSSMLALRAYFILLMACVAIYMVRAVRQYEGWLRDNFADLEHKEVRNLILSQGILLLMSDSYASYIGGMTYEYIVQACGLVLVCYLPWHVETLSDLNLPDQ